MIGLRAREKRLAAGLAAVMAGLSLYGFVIAPRMARVRTLQRVIPEKQQELKDLAAKTRQVMTLSSRLAVIRQVIDSAPRVEFLPAIASIVEAQGLQTHLTTIEQQASGPQTAPGQIVVEISLQKVSYGQVCDLLERIQTKIPLARVGTLHLSRNSQDGALLDATMTLRRPQSTAEAARSGQDRSSR